MKQRIKRLLRQIPIFGCFVERRDLKARLSGSLVQNTNALRQYQVNGLAQIESRLASGWYEQASGDEQSDYVVSLTTYGKRLDTVHLTIISLLLQDNAVPTIILWLSKDEFNDESLPENLLSLKRYGLVIRYCEDLKSYKKLIPALNSYPDKVIITVDDDVIYPTNHIEKLLEKHKQFPEAIVCHRAHQVILDKSGYPGPYRQWQFDVASEVPSYRVFPVGIGGVLYPPGAFDEQVINQDIFVNLAPYADDIWFKAMGTLNGTKAVVVDEPMPYEDYWQILDSGPSLWETNRVNNDKQLKAVLNHYPEISFK